jgi:hypothetical protein
MKNTPPIIHPNAILNAAMMALVNKKEGPSPLAAPNGYKPSNAQQRSNWNRFLDFMASKGLGGSTDLDKRDRTLGMDMLNEFNKNNPNFKVDPSFVPVAQYESHLIRRKGEFPGLKPEDAKYAFAKLSPQFKERPISAVDNWLGSQTSKQYYPNFERVSASGKQSFGTSFEDYISSVPERNLKDAAPGIAFRQK